MRCAAVTIIIAILAAGAAPAATDAFTWLHNAFAPVDAGDAIGNGGLTVTFSNTGRIASIHWPSPGCFDQLTYSIETDDAGRWYVPKTHGLCWATRQEESFSWELAGDLEDCRTQSALVGRFPAPLTAPDLGTPTVPDSVRSSAYSPQTERELGCLVGGGGSTGTPQFFVHSQRDVLVARFEPGPMASPTKIYWCANFTPCTRLIPELPIADSTFDYANDFAVFTPDNGRTIVHFRPEALKGSYWDDARKLATTGGHAPAWTQFDEGVWIAQSPIETPTGFQCGVYGTPASAFKQVEAGVLQGCTAAVGECDSAFEFTCSAQQEGEQVPPITIYIAFGRTYSAAIENLDYARAKGYHNLLREASEGWRKRLSPQRPVTHMSDKMLETILTCMDRETGALVRTPLASPPLHVDIPRHGVMGAYALARAGRHDLVRKRIGFYLDAVRETDSPGRPAGSVPAALYTNGQDAVPHLVLDAQAPAWVLWLCAEHTRTLIPEERAAFVDAIWPKVELAAEFLAAWQDPRTGMPRTAFNPETLRDGQAPEQVVRTYMGLESGLALAKLAGQERPDWRKRLQELEAIIRAGYMGPDGFWNVARPERFWNISLVPRTHPRWHESLSNSVGQLFVSGPSPEVSCEIVFAAATLLPPGADARKKASHVLETGMLDNMLIPPALGLGCCVPDSYLAALQYMAWMELAPPDTP